MQVTSVPSDARLQPLKHVNKPITWLGSVVIVLSMPVVGPLLVSAPVGGGEAHTAGPGAPTCVDREVFSCNEVFSITTSRGIISPLQHLCGWDGWVCGLGAVGASSIFGLVRRVGAFTGRLLTFALVSGLQLAQHNRGIKCHFFIAAFPSKLEVMVGDTLTRASALRVGLGVGGALIASGSRTRPSHSCDGWVCDLGVVGGLLIFGLTRGAGAFAVGLLTFALVSGCQLARHNRGIKCHFFIAAFPSQLEAMVGGALARASAFRVGLGVSGATIVSGSCTRPSHLWISRVLTSSLSLGISSLFCRATQCM
jgi:hypothetical protein